MRGEGPAARPRPASRAMVLVDGRPEVFRFSSHGRLSRPLMGVLQVLFFCSPLLSSSFPFRAQILLTQVAGQPASPSRLFC